MDISHFMEREGATPLAPQHKGGSAAGEIGSPESRPPTLSAQKRADIARFHEIKSKQVAGTASSGSTRSRGAPGKRTAIEGMTQRDDAESSNSTRSAGDAQPSLAPGGTGIDYRSKSGALRKSSTAPARANSRRSTTHGSGHGNGLSGKSFSQIMACESVDNFNGDAEEPLRQLEEPGTAPAKSPTDPRIKPPKQRRKKGNMLACCTGPKASS
eukprot:SAG31_NODE_4707_length_3019_cov_1.720205_5_plen_213_part_00